MTRVNLVGPADDGEHLVVATEAGEQYTLPVTQSLRTVVESAQPTPVATPEISPKDIQRRIRAGQSAEDIAAATGLSVEKLRRYEGPVLAEREYIAQMAQSTQLGREVGAPRLGELVADRLASRGIAPELVTWDASRDGSHPWRVSASYPLAGGRARAVWSFDHGTHTVRAQDDEARWLTETEILNMPAPTRHLAPVRERQPGEAPPTVALYQLEGGISDKAKRSTDELLAELQEKRGTREIVEAQTAIEDDEEFEGFGPQKFVRQAQVEFGSDGSAARATAGGDSAAPHSSATPAAGPPSGEGPRPARAARKGRASIPRWDEIVFGASTD